MVKCQRCGTEYVYPTRECDWCPGETPVKVPEIPVLTDDCPHRLECARKEILRLQPKAARWDALRLMAHKFGNHITEVIEALERKFSK